MSDKDFKVKNKLIVKGITSAGPIVSDASGNFDSIPYIATQYGGTGTTTSPSSGQVLYSASGTTYAPTTLSSIVTQQTPTDGASGTKTYVGTTTPSAPVTGDIWIDSTAGNLPTLQRWIKTAAGAETSLSGNDDNSVTLTYVVGTEQVYQNGVLLVRNVDYTATTGTSISFTSALVAGDSVNVLSFLGGSVADTYTQAQANSTFYPTATTQIAGKNKIINGDFSVAQRGTTFTNLGVNNYHLDRWFFGGGSNLTGTITQETFTPGSAPVAGYEGKNYCRYNITVNTMLEPNISYKVEDVRTFAGQTVTLSFWARASVATSWGAFFYDQYFGTGGSSNLGGVNFANGVTIGTSWQRYSYTINVPSIAGKTIGAGSYFSFYIRMPNYTIGTFDFWGFQLESGSVATTFTPAGGGHAQAELALCQRYYWRNTVPTATKTATGIVGRSTTVADAIIQFPVTMRTNPSAVEYGGGTLVLTEPGVNAYNITSIAFVHASYQTAFIQPTTASGLSVGKVYSLDVPTNGYLGFSAEL